MKIHNTTDFSSPWWRRYVKDICRFWGFPYKLLHDAYLDYIPRKVKYHYKGLANWDLQNSIHVYVSKGYRPIYCGEWHLTGHQLTQEECVIYVTSHEVFHLVQFNERIYPKERDADWAAWYYIMNRYPEF